RGDEASTAGRSSFIAFAFNRYPSAPVASAAVRISASLFLVTKINRELGECWRNRFAASIPVSICIPISKKKIAWWNSGVLWTASTPSHASPITSHSGRACNMVRTRTRHSAKSSATRIRRGLSRFILLVFNRSAAYTTTARSCHTVGSVFWKLAFRQVFAIACRFLSFLLLTALCLFRKNCTATGRASKGHVTEQDGLVAHLNALCSDL